MTSCCSRRSCRCLIATTTFLLSRPCRTLICSRPQSYSLSKAASFGAAGIKSLGSGTVYLGTRLQAVRTPMIGPAAPPAAPTSPIFDSDGKELSKPTKRKVAVVVGFVGTAFHGWQQSTDRDVRTVEGELETALWKAGAIADSNYGDLNKIGWGRTSRTDKGVHASKTVAAAKLMFPQETFTEAGLSQFAKDRINEHLPDDIRCFSVAKVPKSFRGREECTLREYTYYLPKDLLRDDGELQKFRDLLQLFVGTHSFHNFASTKGRQLKEVRKRVQASIDRKMAAGGVAAAGGITDAAVQETEDEEDFGASTGGSKRERSRDDWRTYRHMKRSAAERKEEDEWYRKKGSDVSDSKRASHLLSSASGEAAQGIGSRSSQPVQPAQKMEVTHLKDEPNALIDSASEASAIPKAVGSAVSPRKEYDSSEAAVAHSCEHVTTTENGVAAAKGTQEPEKVLLLRELRTSIYSCDVQKDTVRHKREGQAEADEFVRIDVRGKAFVYNQIRLMIGGALGEARGDLMEGFVEAALKTPYKIRVPLAPAEGLVLESQAFTRHTNALLLDPRELGNIGGTLTVWGAADGGNSMQTTGRLQSLLSLQQLEEAERWRDSHIVPAVAEAWAARGAADMFLEAVRKFFIGQQQEESLVKAIKETLSEIDQNERLAEEKHNKFRALAREKGSTKYKDLLPKNIATHIVCKFRILPGNKVSAIQRGVVKHMEKEKLPALAENEEVLAYIEKIGVDQMASDGGFVAPDIDTSTLTANLAKPVVAA